MCAQRAAPTIHHGLGITILFLTSTGGKAKKGRGPCKFIILFKVSGLIDSFKNCM